MSARNDHFGLTEIQGDILDFVKGEILENQMPPTRAEIAKHFGWKSPNAAECHLKLMERKGVICLIPGISRGIRVTL